MIGSHNSFSYLPPKNLWGKLTRLWGRCQSLNLQEQYDRGARFFDVRLRIIENDWHLVHNKVDYGSCNENDLLNKLKSLCSEHHDPVYFRFILDERQRPACHGLYKNAFLSYIKELRRLIPNMKISECITFWDWQYYWEGIPKEDMLCVEEYHASVKAKWYQYILGTRWYAKRYNKRVLCPARALDSHLVTLIDFVEYQNKSL